MYTKWKNLLKSCLLDPDDIKKNNSFKLFKLLYENTKDISPAYADICAEDALKEAMEEKNDDDFYSEFNLNAFLFKTNTVRFIQEQLGNPVPKIK